MICGTPIGGRSIGLCDYASGAGKAQEHAKPLTSRLRQVRMGKGVSLVKLARDARVTKLTIINIEAGRTRPRTDTVRKLAGALGVPPEEVAPGTVTHRTDEFLRLKALRSCKE